MCLLYHSSSKLAFSCLFYRLLDSITCYFAVLWYIYSAMLEPVSWCIYYAIFLKLFHVSTLLCLKLFQNISILLCLKVLHDISILLCLKLFHECIYSAMLEGVSYIYSVIFEAISWYIFLLCLKLFHIAILLTLKLVHSMFCCDIFVIYRIIHFLLLKLMHPALEFNHSISS